MSTELQDALNSVSKVAFNKDGTITLVGASANVSLIDLAVAIGDTITNATGDQARVTID